MKLLEQYTNEEKIKIFNDLWNKSFIEFNESANSDEDDGHDEYYFYDDVIDSVLHF